MKIGIIGAGHLGKALAAGLVKSGIRQEQIILNARSKETLEAQKQKSHQFARGKQSLKQLMAQNAGATNIEVDESNIKSFDRVARKYHIDYAVKKDKTLDPPKYFVFFKSRDHGACCSPVTAECVISIDGEGSAWCGFSFF